MAVKKSDKNDRFLNIAPDTIIDVVSIKDEKVIVTPMEYEQSLLLKSKNGWRNIIYQKGFHSYKTNFEVKK